MKDCCKKAVQSILDRRYGSYVKGKRDGLEEAAKVADRYEDQINGTQDFRNGWRESAEAIEEAIRALKGKL